ncbi:MAG: hypothetical protein K8W52_28745 [Deltaproteobacteria bacterium]|nr:hypothetical protein [Deltaproteobacteria bacterium]
MNTTARLDEIIQRQRTGRSLDLLFAIFIAMLMVLQVAGLRSAAADSRQAPVATAAQVSAVSAPVLSCSTASIC